MLNTEFKWDQSTLKTVAQQTASMMKELVAAAPAEIEVGYVYVQENWNIVPVYQWLVQQLQSPLHMLL